MVQFGLATPQHPAPISDGNWVEGHNGEPLFQDKPAEILFSEGDFVWKERNGGFWEAIEPGQMKICLPNIVDDFPSKLIRLQIRWSFPAQSPPPQLADIFGMDAEDGPLFNVSVINTSTVQWAEVCDTPR